MREKLEILMQRKEIKMGVLGLGYVGLPLALSAAKNGFCTRGFDPDGERIEKLKVLESYVEDVTSQDIRFATEAGSFQASTDFSGIADMDILFICVPTPLDRNGQPDTGCIESAAKAIATHMKGQTLVILESTTYPGTTRELLMPILEEKGRVCGQDFYLGFSPERVDVGNSTYHAGNTPKIVGGMTGETTEKMASVYKAIWGCPVHQVSSPEVAEMAKLLENTYRNINIGLINEIAIFCDKIQVSIWEVIEAAKTKPYGFQAFYPGTGLGGHCIPLDPGYLAWKAREYRLHMSMIETSMKINEAMPEYSLHRIFRILNSREKPFANPSFYCWEWPLSRIFPITGKARL